MNRELKFRAWSSKFQKYLATGFYIVGETTLFDLLNQHRLEELDTLTIQQFTGLKDKNGKDIYEGDIVRYSLGEKEIINKIIWDHFGFRTAELNDEGCYPLCEGLEFEVVGNIFENLELISSSNQTNI